MFRNIVFAGIALCAICTFFTGCKRELYKSVPVSGVVTVDGKPAVDCVVTFNPMDGINPGPSSSGKTDDKGKFSLILSSSPPRPGAVVGRSAVRIIWQNPNRDTGIVAHPKSGDPVSKKKSLMKKMVPSPYKFPAGAVDGSLIFQVPAQGTTEAVFAF